MEPEKDRPRRHEHDRRDEDAHHAVGKPLDRRLARLRLLHRPHDAGQDGIRPCPGYPNEESPRPVQRPRDDRVPGGFRHGGRLPGQERFVRLGCAFDHDSVHRHPLPGDDLHVVLRGKGGDGSDIPLCGVPYHSATPYLAKLIEAGEKVAICEQVEDPKSVKGIVRREVVRVVTPGLVMDGENLAPKENNYLLCLVPQEAAEVGLAYLDLSTGEFRVTELSGIDAAIAEIACVKPREILLPVKGRDTGLLASLGPLGADCLVSWLEEWVEKYPRLARKPWPYWAAARRSQRWRENSSGVFLTPLAVPAFVPIARFQ